MTTSGTFRALVRHEFKFKGSWRKSGRSPIARKWWLIYMAVLLAAAIGVTTYFAIHNSLRLESIWYATLGLPYVIFFIGHGGMKREWENDTYGWWLTLPYPRLWLVAAKWIAGLLRMLVVWVGLFVLATFYTLIIALTLAHYTLADVGAFVLIGFNWLVLVIGFSPLIMAFGILTADAHYTALRPLTPILWVLFMGGGGLIWSGLGNLMATNRMFGQLEGTLSPSFWPYSWEMPVAMAVSWIVAYLIVRWSASLLEHHLHA